MKKILQISILMLALLVSVSIFAQRGKGDPEARATKMTERLTEALSLSDEQAKEIKAIHLKYGERMKAMHEQEDRDGMRAAMKQMRSDAEQEIKAILTEEQAAKFDEMPKRGHRKGGKGHKGHKVSKEQHAAMKQIKDEKVMPILLEQRAKLESKISATDKQRIAELRIEVDAKKEAKKAEMKARRADREKGERPSEEEIAERKAAHKAKREAMKNDPLRLEVKALVEKYQSDIEPLLAEVEPELKAIKEEAKANFKEGRGGEGAKKGRKGKGKRKGKNEWSEEEKAEYKANKALRHQARFLLLDPNASVQVSESNLISDIKVYPNPSLGESQLEYTLKSAGEVTIELHDKSGNLLKVVDNLQQTAGKHKTTINFSQYTTGIYYVVVKDANGKAISTKVIR